jgi:hypothetical protein
LPSDIPCCAHRCRASPDFFLAFCLHEPTGQGQNVPTPCTSMWHFSAFWGVSSLRS